LAFIEPSSNIDAIYYKALNRFVNDLPNHAMNLNISTSEKPQAEELKILFMQTSWASKRRIQNIEKMLERLDVFVTIRDEEELIGFGRALTDGIYRALIDDIIVDKNYQKQGLGKMIVDRLIDQLYEVEEVFLNTNPEQEDFYKKLGFTIPNCLTMKK